MFKSYTPEYRAWQQMKDRCLNPKNKRFQHYGGRGIKVCARWQRSFDSFLADVGPRPSPKHSIERIKNNRGYTPKNVRWATAKEQANNRRSTIFVSLRGKRTPLAEACRKLGVARNTVWMRISRGMTPTAAIRQSIRSY